MEELVAKRYIKAIESVTDVEAFENVADIFASLADSFSDSKVKNVIESPYISKKEKTELLLASVESAKSKEVNNLIALLVEKNRINVIPAIASEMKKILAKTKKRYSGTIYSDNEIDTATIQSIAAGLSKRVDATVALNFVKTDFNGIKVDVEDLGLEINFSKERLNAQLIDHILKAI